MHCDGGLLGLAEENVGLDLTAQYFAEDADNYCSLNTTLNSVGQDFK